MAHFQAGIKGNRGPATRLGTAKSGICAFARGWNGGARIDLWQQGGQDWIRVAVGRHEDVNRLTIYRGPVSTILTMGGTYAYHVE